MAAASRRCDGRFGRIIIDDEVAVSQELLDQLCKTHSIGELDLRRARLSDSLLLTLESLRQMETLRLSRAGLELRWLRELQIALPACHVLVDEGTPVDVYGTPYHLDVGQPNRSS